MAEFRLVKDQAANQSVVDYPVPASNLPPPERRRLINNQSDAETQRLLRQARANDQSPAETQRLLNQNARVAVSAFEAQTGENQSAAETARLLRQNSFLSNYTDTSGSPRITADEDTGQRPSVKSNPVSNYPSFGAGNTAGVRDNPLDNYANYTYGITLFVGSASDYSPGAVNGDVMVASGGIRESRLPQFYEDFYFDSFKLESVIGLNAQSRSSNVITIEFTIIEPFGISLMDRLLDVANSLGAENWHEMVFTLKVDFYGNNDDGAPVNPIAGQTKHFQTKIIGCDIKATSRGSEYRFTAIPFSHQAYTQNVGTTPATHEAHGQTIQDIFESEGLGSYAKFLNKHQTDLAKNKKHQELADVYKFVINDQIGKAEIVTSLLNSTRSTPMPNDESKTTKTPQAQQARKSGSSVPLEMQKQRVAINAGTSVIDVINLVVRNSTYISGQVKPGGGGDGRVNWFKITPKIEYGDYDKKRNTHQKTITYHVDPYVIYNTKYPDAPVGLPPTSKWSKEYNYIYTGLNQQIIDFSIDFNTMFYTMMTTSREKLAKTDVKPEDTESEKAEDKGSGQANGPKSIAPAQVHPVAATDASTSQQGTNNVENIAANDLYKSLMSSSRGDMINVKLKIAGDPDFVKQDDIFYGPGSGAGSSIATDTEEVYIKIFFRAPTDIDQETGLMDFSSYPDTVFSGIYRVLRVESVFERGQFTQTLDSIRLFGQENGGGGGSMGAGSTDQRRSDAPSGAKEMLEGKALDDALRKMSGRVEYSDEPVRMDDIYESIRENPPVSNVTDADEVARENTRLLNRAISSSRVSPTTVDPTNVETLFSTGMAP